MRECTSFDLSGADARSFDAPRYFNVITNLLLCICMQTRIYRKHNEEVKTKKIEVN